MPWWLGILLAPIALVVLAAHVHLLVVVWTQLLKRLPEQVRGMTPARRRGSLAGMVLILGLLAGEWAALASHHEELVIYVGGGLLAVAAVVSIATVPVIAWRKGRRMARRRGARSIAHGDDGTESRPG